MIAIEDFANEVADGYGFNISEMDDKQTERFYEVLTRILERIKAN